MTFNSILLKTKKLIIDYNKEKIMIWWIILINLKKRFYF